LDGSGTPVWDYSEVSIDDSGGKLYTIREGTQSNDDETPSVCWHLSDHLGSSSITYDLNGFYKAEEYTPFGETSFGSYSRKKYRFCGKELDAESGLYYYGLRYYAPWTCRFISVDPLALDYPYYTPYQYAGNMPINFIDLDGAEPWNTFRSAERDATSTESSNPPVIQPSHLVLTITSPYMTQRALDIRNGVIQLPDGSNSYPEYLANGAVKYAVNNQYPNDWNERYYSTIDFPENGAIQVSSYTSGNPQNTNVDVFGTLANGENVLLGSFTTFGIKRGDPDTGPFGGFNLTSKGRTGSSTQQLEGYGSSTESLDIDVFLSLMPNTGGFGDIFSQFTPQTETKPEWMLKTGEQDFRNTALPERFNEYFEELNFIPYKSGTLLRECPTDKWNLKGWESVG
jgi:RHS repeat-associated protein